MILLLIMALCACRQVVVNSADELRMSDWQTETKNGMQAELTFEGDTGAFCIKSATDDEVTVISGTAAIDSTDFYITSSELCKTYTFAYKVFHDRAEVTYQGDTLTFYAMEKSTTTAP